MAWTRMRSSRSRGPHVTETINVTNVDGDHDAAADLALPAAAANACSATRNATGGVLGPRTHQLNGDMTYTATGVTDNQLRTWNHLGMFDTAAQRERDRGLPEGGGDHGHVGHARESRALLRGRQLLALPPSRRAIGRYDARYDTPILDQDIFGATTGLPNKLRRFNPRNSRIIIRDSLHCERERHATAREGRRRRLLDRHRHRDGQLPVRRRVGCVARHFHQGAW